MKGKQRKQRKQTKESRAVDFYMYGFKHRMRVRRPFPKMLILNLMPLREMDKGDDAKAWAIPFILFQTKTGTPSYQMANDIDILLSDETQLKIQNDIKKNIESIEEEESNEAPGEEPPEEKISEEAPEDNVVTPEFGKQS